MAFSISEILESALGNPAWDCNGSAAVFLWGGCVQTQSNISACKAIGSS